VLHSTLTPRIQDHTDNKTFISEIDLTPSENQDSHETWYHLPFWESENTLIQASTTNMKHVQLLLNKVVISIQNHEVSNFTLILHMEYAPITTREIRNLLLTYPSLGHHIHTFIPAGYYPKQHIFGQSQDAKHSLRIQQLDSTGKYSITKRLS